MYCTSGELATREYGWRVPCETVQRPNSKYKYLGLTPAPVAEKIGPTEPVKQAEKIAPAVKETPGQKLRREIAQQQPQQRRSGGMRV